MLVAALRGWESVVGSENVSVDRGALDAASTATFATKSRVTAIVRPASTTEVQRCIDVARTNKVPVYPTSRGRNWGFGSRVPYSDANVLLDLGRMDKILAFDEKLAYATVQAGVSFRQLADFLTERGSRLMTNPTGSTPDGSVVGNACERGMGRGPYADRFAHIAAMEVVLADGSAVRTGMSRFGGDLGRLYKWGVGPYVDGIFTQSNLGVVTEMTTWLARTPEHFEVVFFPIEDPRKLPDVFDALREIGMCGAVHGGTVVWNDYKVLSSFGHYGALSRDGTGRRAIPRSELARLRTEWGGTEWEGVGAVFGDSREHVEVMRGVFRRILGPVVSDLTFIDDQRASELEEHFKRTGDRRSKRLSMMQKDSLHRGIPNEGMLKQVYWRKAAAPAQDLHPDRDRCGVMWCCPVIPLDGPRAAEAVRLIEEITLAHDFEPNLAVLCVHERTAEAFAAVMYDRDVPGEEERAERWHEAIVAAVFERGVVPYRFGVNGAALVPEDEAFASLVGKIRNALDPDGIIAPGRYEFRPRGR